MTWKRIASILLAVALAVGLGGCIPLSYDFEDVDIDAVDSVAFFDISGMDKEQEEAALSAEPFYVLPAEQREDFCNDLTDMDFSDQFMLMAPSDPSFSYGDYVVRLTFADGSYKLMSCGGYNTRHDAQGNETGNDHYGCDDGEWIDLIFSYAGHRSSVLHYQGAVRVITVEDNREFVAIFDGMKPVEAPQGVSFDDADDFISWQGGAYSLAENGRPYIRYKGKVYEITAEQQEHLAGIMVKYISYWRYGREENPRKDETQPGA